MKLLFATTRPGCLLGFESFLERLLERGHAVHVAFEHQGSFQEDVLLERLAHNRSALSWEELGREGDQRIAGRQRWRALAAILRGSLDCLRYLQPRYDAAPGLRLRVAARTPSPLLWLSRHWPLRSRRGLRAATAGLRVLERALPVDPSLNEVLSRYRPDVVLVSPLVEFGSSQADWVRAARVAGCGSVACVGGWDHLTTTGTLHALPDQLLVWNDAQKAEAVEHHGVPAGRIVVTGAHCYDHWFERRPRSRNAFCGMLGLDPSRPYLLYAGSAPFVIRRETPTVEEWLRAVRSSADPRLRNAGVLIRPHPRAWFGLRSVDVPEIDDVVVWPIDGETPVGERARANYFDSLYHSAGVVGIDTSAFVEASIAGRAVCAVPEHDASSAWTFRRYGLTRADGGPVRVARDLAGHLEQLAQVLAAGEADPASRSRFLERLVRPAGLETPVTPRLVEIVEQLALRTSTGVRYPARVPAARLFLAPLALPAPGLVSWARRRDDPRSGRPDPGRLRGAGGSTPPPPPGGRPRLVPAEWSAEAAAASVAVRETLERLARSSRPVLVGPWLSEVGFELLYWIPFLRWACEYAGLAAERLVVVSRGGVAPWYGDTAARYAELLDYFDVPEFQTRNEAGRRDVRKQFGIGAFDREILERVARRLRLGAFELLHPSVMYNLFDPFWSGRVGGAFVEAHATHRALAPDGPDVSGTLPGEYVAARFYANASFPSSPENQAFVERVLADLTATTDVVLLDPQLRIDDHRDFELPARDRVHTLAALKDPRSNLAVQTAVISRARAFVGTFGGLSYLAPLCRVDSLAFYSHPRKLLRYHIELAQRVFPGVAGGSLVTLDTHATDLLRAALGGRGREPQQ